MYFDARYIYPLNDGWNEEWSGGGFFGPSVHPTTAPDLSSIHPTRVLDEPSQPSTPPPSIHEGGGSVIQMFSSGKEVGIWVICILFSLFLCILQNNFLYFRYREIVVFPRNVKRICNLIRTLMFECVCVCVYVCVCVC